MRQNKLFKFLSLSSLVVLLTSACSDTTSSNIKTSGLFVQYAVTGQGTSQVQCQAVFQVGGGTGTYVILDSGDNVTCNGQPMSSSEDIFNQVTYTTTVPASGTGNYTITLNRANESPYNSTVIMPPAFIVTSPKNGASIKKGTVLPVSWTPSSNSPTTMSVYLNFSVSGGETTSFYNWVAQSNSPETGSASFPSTDTQVTPPVAGTLPATLTFTRGLAGTMDPSLSGGIYGQQTQMVNISLVD